MIKTQSCSPPVNTNKKLETKSGWAFTEGDEQVTVFDWDDTLMPSSFLSANGYRLDSDKEMSEELLSELAQIEASVVSFIKLALSKASRVYIITNAETGWVELSAKKFMPKVVPLLDFMTVISARSTYERAYPSSPLQWKYQAFHHNLAGAFSANVKSKSVISFGDSHVEREVVKAVSKAFDYSRCKSVKFAERPSLEQLCRQINIVTKSYQHIFNHQGDLDLVLTISTSQ
jgi:hypothetical protein